MPNMTRNIKKEDDRPEFRITPTQQAAASCTGAVVTSLFVTPLDVVKIRLQAQQSSTVGQSSKVPKCFLYCNGLMDHYCGPSTCSPVSNNGQWYQRPGHFNGTIDAFVKISRTEGLASLWSGLGPTLVLAIPATVVYFVAYEQIRLRFKDWYNRNNTTDTHVQPFWIPLTSGSLARISSASLVSPLELIRTKMQSQRLSYLEIGKALKDLVRQDGIKGLWKGVVPTLLRDVPFSAVYWVSYESIKSMFEKPNQSAPSYSLSFIAGAISGGLAASITVPFDVVKTHQQIELGDKTLFTDQPKKTRTTWQIFHQIRRDHGIRGLYAGITPRLIKVAPACAIMISSFEYGKVFFYRYNERSYGTEWEQTPDYYQDDYFPSPGFLN